MNHSRTACSSSASWELSTEKMEGSRGPEEDAEIRVVLLSSGQGVGDGAGFQSSGDMFRDTR